MQARRGPSREQVGRQLAGGFTRQSLDRNDWARQESAVDALAQGRQDVFVRHAGRHYESSQPNHAGRCLGLAFGGSQNAPSCTPSMLFRW